jgi:hypothetical protein
MSAHCTMRGDGPIGHIELYLGHGMLIDPRAGRRHPHRVLSLPYRGFRRVSAQSISWGIRELWRRPRDCHLFMGGRAPLEPSRKGQQVITRFGTELDEQVTQLAERQGVLAHNSSLRRSTTTSPEQPKRALSPPDHSIAHPSDGGSSTT